MATDLSKSKITLDQEAIASSGHEHKEAMASPEPKHALTLSESAAAHVSSFIAKRGKGLGIRLAVRTSGCSGMAYKLEFVDEENPDDIFFESHGLRIYTDAKSLSYIDGTQLDYVKEGVNEGFKFNNPNVKNECGCGESFNV